MGFHDLLVAINSVLWHDGVLFFLLGVGVLFTVWSAFSQYRALTHGSAVIRGYYDDEKDPGAINHFQALSAALSGTVGLGNIGGVALAVALGGPGAVFWMWIVGVLGMAVKTMEVTLAMIYRNTDDPDNPHGGPMWVASKGLAAMNPKLAPLGSFLGGLFCVALLVSTLLDGNMFQAWNVGNITQEYFGIPAVLCGIVLAILVGLVLIGGIKRIGSVTGKLVPFMCAVYLLAAFYVLGIHFTEIPAMLRLIVVSAFAPQEAAGAFLGGTMGYALMVGMRRALFSNEAGRGSSPIAHSAAKTDEPVREGVVAGLEPFIDTIVVCTMTALVIIASGVWNRDAEVHYEYKPEIVSMTFDTWSVETRPVPQSDAIAWKTGDNVFMVVEAGRNPQTGNTKHRLNGVIQEENGVQVIAWDTFSSKERPRVLDGGVYATYPGATLTAKAFDNTLPGLGKWMVTLATWLFAISTIITWGYYGEQAMVFLLGNKSVLPYKIVYCILVVVATTGFIRTPDQLDNFTGIGVGLMLWVNIPILLIFGGQTVRVYKDYIRRLKSGQMPRNPSPPRWRDLLRGK